MHQIITKLKRIQQNYTPSPNVQKNLNEIVVLPLVGPALVGKSTIMQHVDMKYNLFHRDKGFTTRPLRKNEDPKSKIFLNHDEKTLQKIYHQITARELVQFAVHPTTGYLYGTVAEDFRPKYTMMDTLYNSVDGLKKLPFKEVKPVIIVCQPSVWQKRFNNRKFSQNEGQKRIKEGIDSLIWSLGQRSKMLWINNSNQSIDFTSKNLVTRVKNDNFSSSDVANIADSLLLYLKSL